MRLARAIGVIGANIRRNKRSFVLSAVGLVVGVGAFTFFVALGSGIQAGVLNRIYPVNQIEVEPATVGVVGLRAQVLDSEDLGETMVEALRALPHVTAVYPKMRSRLQARLWGGKALFGYDLRTEAFFDGLEPGLLVDELARLERVEDKRARQALRRRILCKQDEECPLGQECGPGGQCARIEYWRRFVSREEGGSCATDGDCPRTDVCAAQPDGGRRCQPLACKLPRVKAQWSPRPQDARGRLVGRCANGVDPGSAACVPLPCPGDSYCAARDVKSTAGHCEDVVPVVLSPFLIEVFNSSVASSLGFQALDGVDALLGARFRIHLGGSYFSANLPEDRQAIKTAEVVGFSSKALDFGLTVPLDLVRAYNTRFKGPETARTYDSFILETEANEDVSALIGELEARGFALSRKSQDARKAADLLFILTLVFSFISLVIMGIAAVNITHTFLMIVSERRYEIGIMRALGATRRDVRHLILGEAVAVGLFGGVLGEAVSYGMSRLANLAASELFMGLPYKPDDFFVWEPSVLAGALVFALVFCLLGAWVPARRAAHLDPARVLVS